MKKPVKVIFAIVVAIAILIAGVSLFFPTVINNLASGTFGKAEKYRSTQMTEKDIQLRSEFTSNTDQLMGMIQGLIYFSLFTQDLSNKIDSCISAYELQGICSHENGCANIELLRDYSDFIKNNNKTLGTTISMLTGFYLKDQSDQSFDVEKNLRDFGNYVNNLNEKDSILEVAIRGMDNFLLTNKTLQTKKTELNQLKAIRDQLLIGSIQLAGMVQDKPLCATLCSYAISSQDNLKAVFGQQKLDAVASQQKLNLVNSMDKFEGWIVGNQVSFGSAEQLKDVMQVREIGNVVKAQGEDLGGRGGIIVGAIVIYNRDDLKFVVSNAAELSKNLSGAQLEGVLCGVEQLGKYIGVAYCSQQGLNLVASNFDLKLSFTAQYLGSSLKSSQLDQIIQSQQGLGAVTYCSQFVGFVGQLGNQDLGIIPK
jgi:hypothetical protein